LLWILLSIWAWHAEDFAVTIVVGTTVGAATFAVTIVGAATIAVTIVGTTVAATFAVTIVGTTVAPLHLLFTAEWDIPRRIDSGPRRHCITISPVSANKNKKRPRIGVAVAGSDFER